MENQQSKKADLEGMASYYGGANKEKREAFKAGFERSEKGRLELIREVLPVLEDDLEYIKGWVDCVDCFTCTSGMNHKIQGLTALVTKLGAELKDE